MQQLLRPGFIVRLVGCRSLLNPVPQSCLTTCNFRLQSSSATAASPDVSAQSANSRPDKLYRMVEVEVRGHDKAVLDSYETFTTSAARELDITVHKTWEDWRHIYRRTLLRSVFVVKRCREQYEMRTYFRIMQFKYLTGSTADTFLEYIQRNLPEGVSMRVARHQIETVPGHLKPPHQEDRNDNSNADGGLPEAEKESSQKQ